MTTLDDRFLTPPSMFDTANTPLSTDSPVDSELRLRLLGDNLPDSYVYQATRTIDGLPQFLYVSNGVERLHGVTAAAVIEDASLIYRQILPEDQPGVITAEKASRDSLTDFMCECRIRNTAGKLLWLSVRSHPSQHPDGQVVWDGVASDITHLKQMEQSLQEALVAQQSLNKKLEEAQNQLLQSEKMASIGQLAAGVAHELNNPIGFVSSNLGTLESYLRDLFEITDAYTALEATAPPDCPGLDKVRTLKQRKDYDFLRTDIFQLMAESKDGLARVAKIVKDLKDFSRAGEAAWQMADLHQGLDSTLNIVWNELKYKCTVKKDYGELPDVWCVPSQLNQVFMNLLVNAAHAIPEKGDITIRTGRREAEVFVAISDTGSGIAPDHLNRIFEPFFTTKPVGKGTGLGLSLAYSIVQKHHGRFEVRSEVGKGTTFTIWLPIEATETQEAAVSPAPTA